MEEHKLARKVPQKINECQISVKPKEENPPHSWMWLRYLIFQNPVENVFFTIYPAVAFALSHSDQISYIFHSTN